MLPPVSFDPQRYLQIQSGAVDLADELHRAVGECLAAGAQNLFFVGSGGAGILMLPAAGLLQARSTFPVQVVNPAELVETGNVNLGSSSIVVIPSLSGTTSESVAALEFCQDRGATVIALTGHAETPLADGAAYSFVNFAEDDTSCESFYLQSLLIALSVMDLRQELPDYTGLVAQLRRLPEALLEVKRQADKQADELAAHLHSDSYHIITGAGSTWAEAFYYGMCILEEMQWIRTRPVHASDFFHGTLELVEAGVSVVMLKGEDSARPLVERVEKFVGGLTDRTLVLDAAEFELPGIEAELRPLISPIVLAAALERVSAYLEVRADHPLTTRRYYKRMAY
jgi:fructoselysine-6-phosphate deglycase